MTVASFNAAHLHGRFGAQERSEVFNALKDERQYTHEVSLMTSTPDVEQNGVFVAKPTFARVARLAVIWEAVLGAAETLTLSANAQDATDSGGAGAADFGTAFAPTVVATGVGTFRGISVIDLDLVGPPSARAFMRGQITLATSSIGTVLGAAVLIFGDNSELTQAIGDGFGT